eukprot:TRINITY_DN6138_c0_g1_i1.p1 TRINITY_DN6138_c0_g1~~TRINITY_DN6138_c0_g1_i1.p1  ORF type:complete len:743 (-),score=114.27 TRINITY_DN6138_c0_g1_i1:90-2318(-)
MFMFQFNAKVRNPEIIMGRYALYSQSNSTFQFDWLVLNHFLDDQMFGEKTDYISRDETENGNVLLANNPLCSFDTQSGSINEKSFDPKLHSVGKTNRGQVIQFEKIGIQEEGGPFPGHVQIISMATTLSQMSFKDRFECLTSKAFQIVHQDYISDILEFTRAWAQEGKNDIDVNEIVDFLHDVWGRCHDGLQIEWFCRYMLLHPEGIVEKESVERQATKLLNRLTSSSPEENETYTGAFEKLFFMNPERTVKSMVECAFQNKGQQISISTILKECRSFLRVIRSRDGFSVLNGAIMDFLRQIFATDNEHQISYMEPFLRYILLHEVEGQAVPIDDEKSVIDVHELMFNVLLLMSQDDTVPSSAKIELYKNMDWILATYLSTSCSLDKTSSMTSKIERQLSCLVLHVLSSLEKRVEFRDESPCILTSMLDRIKGHILSKPSCCQLLASHLKYYAQNLGYWSWCHIADFFGMIDDHLVESISDAHDTLTLVLSLNSKFPTPDQKVSAFTRFVTFASTSDRSCAQMCKIYTRATSFQHGLGTDTNHGALETDDNHHIVIYDVKELIQVLVQVCQEFVLLLTPDEIKRVLLGFVYKIVRNIVEGLHHSQDQSLVESRIAHDSVRIFLILLKSITKGVVVFSAGQSVPVFYLQSIISIFRDLSKASPVVAYFVFVDALQILSDVPQSWRIYFEPLCLETIEHMQDHAHVKINEITEAITKLKNDEFRSLLILKSVQALQQSQKEAPK